MLVALVVGASTEATVKLSAAGTVCFFAQRTTHLVADVAGYFTDVPEALRVASLVPQN